MALRCLASTGKVMAGCLVSHATVALSLSAARSKCVCSHGCCSGVAWAVGMGW